MEKYSKFTYGNSTIYYSGTETARKCGVTIILVKHHTAAVKRFIPVSDRLLILEINTKPVNLNIQAYAPTSASLEEDIIGEYILQ